ncbi:MAG TPA: hypothetical protein VLY21_04880 [Nitrososphaerales archaeon]|nr:hypothetical protein [Nitrososphaerales archaeon]
MATEGMSTARLLDAYPSGRVIGGVFELEIAGENPSVVAEAARKLLENLKLATKTAKEFK